MIAPKRHHAVVRMGMLAALLLGSAGLLSSCAVGLQLERGTPKAPVRPPWGYIYTKYKAPLSYDAMEAGPIAAKPAKSGSAKTGYFCVPFTYSMASFGWGDASMEAAAKEGGIQKIASADYEAFTILGFYTTFKTTVHGE